MKLNSNYHNILLFSIAFTIIILLLILFLVQKYEKKEHFETLSFYALGPVLANFNMTHTIQSWKVPTTNLYLIILAGAAGGKSDLGEGGSGVIIANYINLNQGDTLQIIVGEYTPFGGGGGGTFIIKNNATLLFAAGGGGARAGPNGNVQPAVCSNMNATTNKNGNTCDPNNNSKAGKDGKGGDGGIGITPYMGGAGGGGGWFSSGGNGAGPPGNWGEGGGNETPGTVGNSIRTYWEGGFISGNWMGGSAAGFGLGGGGGCGGGGGYSGGAGGSWGGTWWGGSLVAATSGGGGGSYDINTTDKNAILYTNSINGQNNGYNKGNGFVQISLGDDKIAAATASGSWNWNQDLLAKAAASQKWNKNLADQAVASKSWNEELVKAAIASGSWNWNQDLLAKAAASQKWNKNLADQAAASKLWNEELAKAAAAASGSFNYNQQLLAKAAIAAASKSWNEELAAQAAAASQKWNKNLADQAAASEEWQDAHTPIILPSGSIDDCQGDWKLGNPTPILDDTSGRMESIDTYVITKSKKNNGADCLNANGDKRINQNIS